MTVKTSQGNEYTVDFIDGPTMTTGQVVLQLQDSRRLPEIAAEFDGLEWLKRESENEGNKEYIGFSMLGHISRHARGVMIMLDKEVNADA